MSEQVTYQMPKKDRIVIGAFLPISHYDEAHVKDLADAGVDFAAMEMDMSYSKAITILNRAEKALKIPLTEKTIGGKGGGGSQLTPEAKEFLKRYEKYREACYEANRRIYHEIFSK